MPITFIEPSNVSEINQAIDIAKSLNLKYFVIGNGSNTLALDYGVGLADLSWTKI